MILTWSDRSTQTWPKTFGARLDCNRVQVASDSSEISFFAHDGRLFVLNHIYRYIELIRIKLEWADLAWVRPVYKFDLDFELEQVERARNELNTESSLNYSRTAACSFDTPTQGQYGWQVICIRIFRYYMLVFGSFII